MSPPSCRISRITPWLGRPHMNSETRMAVRHSLIPLALALLAVGCVGPPPPPVQHPPPPGPHFLPWAGDSPPPLPPVDPPPGAARGGGGASPPSPRPPVR